MARTVTVRSRVGVGDCRVVADGLVVQDDFNGSNGLRFNVVGPF